MPRENKEPILCKDCRFNIKGFCHRNPPQTINNTDAKPPKGEIAVFGIFPYVNCDFAAKGCAATNGCFAGERKTDVQVESLRSEV